MAPLVHPVYTELPNLHLEALSIEDKDINMASLNHPAYNEVPNLILAASSVEGKDIEATTYRIAPPLIELPNELPNLILAASSVEGTDIEAPAYRMALLYPKTPRLVTYKSKTDNCVSCSKIPEQYCTSCCWTEIYCNADGQNDHWPILIKKEYQVLKIQFLIEIIVATVKKESTEDTEATSDLITLLNPKYPRLVTYENKLEDCFSCSKTSKQFCNDCCVMVYYFNADCQKDHWPLLKDMFQVLEIQFLTELEEARIKTKSTEDLRKMIPDIRCAPIKVYHHSSVDPVVTREHSIHTSKEAIEHNNLPRAMQDWCNWKSAGKEYIPSDSESEETETEASETALSYVDFVESLCDTKDAMESESEDQDYEPLENDSDNCELSDEFDISNYEEDYLIVKYMVDCLIAENKPLEHYPEFVNRVFDNKTAMDSDSDDQEYYLSESDSDDCSSSDDSDISDISDNEVDQLIVEWKQYIKKKDYFYYKYIRSKLIAANPSKIDLLDDSDSGAFVPSTNFMDFRDELKVNSQRGSQDEGSRVLDNEAADFIAEYKEFLYADFVERVYDNKLCMESDSEDQEYEPLESSSDDYELSDESDASNHEEGYLIFEYSCNCSTPECNQMDYVELVEMGSADEENIPSDSESSDTDDQEYDPSESDSDDNGLSNESNISNNEDYLLAECKVDSLICEYKQLDYPEFVKRVFDNKPVIESDSEDQEYEPLESDSEDCSSSDESNLSSDDCSSDESNLSYHENKILFSESNQSIKFHDYFIYIYFRSKFITDDLPKGYVFDDSNEECLSIDYMNVQYKQFIYDYFIYSVFDNEFVMDSDTNEFVMDSDTDDIEYIFSNSDLEISDDCGSSDESYVSDYEVDCLIDEWKQYIRNYDYIYYIYYRSKLISDDPSKRHLLPTFDEEILYDF